MMEKDNKRRRRPNFCKEEELKLMDYIQENSKCLLSKESNALQWRQKELAWKRICMQMNAEFGTRRTFDQYRNKFDKMKFEAKRLHIKMSNNIVGGVPQIINCDPILLSLLELLSREEAVLNKNLEGEEHDLICKVEIEPEEELCVLREVDEEEMDKHKSRKISHSEIADRSSLLDMFDREEAELNMRWEWEMQDHLRKVEQEEELHAHKIKLFKLKEANEKEMHKQKLKILELQRSQIINNIALQRRRMEQVPLEKG